MGMGSPVGSDKLKTPLVILFILREFGSGRLGWTARIRYLVFDIRSGLKPGAYFLKSAT